MKRPPLMLLFRRAMPTSIAAPLAVFALLSLVPSVSLAVTPRVHAIVGARIVTEPGHVIPRGTIVIRDGVITAVGASVPVPADARVWKADSLTVYPGLIDAFVTAAHAAPPPQGGGRPGAQPPPPASRRAAHPLRSVPP